MNDTAAICIAIFVFAFVIPLIMGYISAHSKTRCPHCGSGDIRKKKVNPKYNPASYSCFCRKCKSEFFID